MRFLLVLIFLIFSKSYSDEVNHQFEIANQHYRNGEYEKALEIYEKIYKSDYESPELYYNIGNTYFKLEEIASAILFYERARRLSPADEDINYNLKIANLKVVDKIEPIPKLFLIQWWVSITNLNNSQNWATVSIISFWISILLLTIFRITKKSYIKRLTFLGATIIILLALFSFLFAYTQYKYETETNTAIIFAKNVTVKSSPDEAGTDLFVIHDGVKVEILDSIENWKKIRLGDGKIGWIKEETLEII